MKEDTLAMTVFETMTGLRRDGLDWVEYCPEAMEAYGQMWEAYERMAKRLGQPEAGDDDDLEDMVNSLLSMQKIVAVHMFRYGQEYEKNRHHG